VPYDTVVCVRCGQRAEGVPATWSSSAGPDGLTHLCDGCTRQHLRSIEARLDEQWWEPPADR
jgi:cell wall assembly regulator SMI1